jgi:hypothetical protein
MVHLDGPVAIRHDGLAGRVGGESAAQAGEK